MEFGNPPVGERTQRSQLYVALDTLDNALNSLVEAVETGSLDQLSAGEDQLLAEVRNLSQPPPIDRPPVDR